MLSTLLSKCYVSCVQETQKEFYDVTSKYWVVARRSAEEESWSTLDAEDDQIISNAINSTGTHFY